MLSIEALKKTLILDFEKAKQKGERSILVVEDCECIEEARWLKGDFEEWLDCYIVAQGAKYWKWG